MKGRTALRCLVGLLAIASTGADCRKAEQACVDFSGRTARFSLADPTTCFSYPSTVCSELTLPETLTVQVLDRPVSLREGLCAMPRAIIASGDFGDIVFDGPTDGTLEVDGRFGVAEEVLLGDSGCTGRLFIGFVTLGSVDESDSEYWLTTDEEAGPKWSLGFKFVPDEIPACEGVQSECSNSTCFADAVAAD